MIILLALLSQQPQLPRKELVEELRITSPGPDGEFVTLSSVAGRDGRIYLSDSRAPAIHRFDSTGRYLGQIGRSGDGPGAYRIPTTLGMRGDSLWVWDPSHRRITLWDREGKLVREVTLVEGGSASSSGVLLVDGNVATLPSWSSARAREGAATEPVRRYGPDGRRRGTLLSIPVTSASLKIETTPGMFLVGQQPFLDSPLLVAGANGTGFLRVDRSTTGAPQIGLLRYNERGALTWRRSIRYAPTPLDPTVLDSVIRGYTDPPDPRAPRVPEEKVREALVLPAYSPPVLSASIGSDGWSWLRLPTRAGEGARYMVLDAHGTPVFEVRLPLRGRLMAANATRVWVALNNADDLPVAIRYRIE
jgi:hypothetical protein